MEETQDKRVRRTQQALRSALLELMVERGYEQLSVQDILDRAAVGRATFYAHYRSKEELLVRSMDGLRQHLLEHSKSRMQHDGHAPLGFTLAFFRHVDSYRPLWRAIVGRESGFIVERRMRRLLLDVVRMDTRAVSRKSDRVADLTAHYLVGAIMSVMTWWLDSNVRLTPEQVDRLFRKLALPALEGRVSKSLV
jgi:AcrR family transcriptional regulator